MKELKPTAEFNCGDVNSEYPKLVPLLALAAGALAMPQTTLADIVYTDWTSSPIGVGFSSGNASEYFINNLPGTAQLRFNLNQRTKSTSFGTRYYHTLSVGKFGSAAVAIQGASPGWAVPLNNGAAWNVPGSQLFLSVALGIASDFSHFPASGYDHKYLAFEFQDTSKPGTQFRYGWIEVGLNVRNLSAGSGPDVAIYGWAYDTTGSKLTMGQVPEPGSAALLALGALTLGARGVRSWRRNRSAVSES